MKKRADLPWESRSTAAKNAADLLPGLVDEFFSAGRRAALGADLPGLHRFRVRVKRFRYTLELFRPCYGPVLDAKLGSLRGIQECLGRLSDLSIVIRLAGVTALSVAARRELRSTALSFRRLWREFDREGEDVRWKAYLRKARPARRNV